MRQFDVTAVIVAVSITPVFAEDAGIRFADMEVGTTLITRSLSERKKVKAQEFVGKQGGFYIVEESFLNDDGSTKSLGNTYYDMAGRESKAEWHDGMAYYEPYSCEYVSGECTHTLDYPNPLTKKAIKRTRSTQRYSNRIEGDTFILSWKLSSGKVMEVPSKLGPYNLRVSSRYKNVLGELRGHEFVKLIEPASSTRNSAHKLIPTKKPVEVAEVAGPDCDAVYDRLKIKANGDASLCKVKIAKPKYRTCELPQKQIAYRPASHVVLILDASGSMVGKSGGQSKMAVAKREALTFLNALQEDVPVGLMVYGHRGNNKESGKTESCAAIEWAHKIGASKSALAKSIDALQPTGWTPLGGALAFAKQELRKVRRKKDDKVSVPVVYLISDGKETCGGNAVAEAKALHESGVKAAINVIGFDVDDETRTELEAISKAGGGQYFPAADANALRKQMRAIKEAEAAKVRYNYCQLLNLGAMNVVYHNARIELAGCFGREGKKNGIHAMLSQIKEITQANGPENACISDLKRRAYADHSKANKLFLKQNELLKEAQEQGAAEFYANSAFKPLDD